MTVTDKPRMIGLTGDHAVAEAVKLCKPDVVAAYPITPQTIIVERYSDYVADGDVHTEFVTVESEHSAMSACIGASSTGARVFTASASAGIMLMYEMIFVASSYRCPIVMTVANRAISGPINVHGELSDQLLFKDSGWLSFFSENNQEAYDQHILAFKIAEHPDVQLPVAVGLDGFILTHAMEGFYPVSQDQVNSFLPDRVAKYKLDPDNPASFGFLALQDYYTEQRYQVTGALENARKVIPKVYSEWGELTGRYYNPVESFQMEDADYAFVTMGAFAGTAKTAVKELREKGEKVGLIKLRAVRPFFSEDLIRLTKDLKGLISVERAHAFGGDGGLMSSDLKSALYYADNKPLISDWFAGLGGRDLMLSGWKEIYDLSKKTFDEGKSAYPRWYGVRL
ncbi:MAG: transketolase C-terminal domain-containing protein [Candidatus Hodarchaeales archaeon]